MRKKLALTLAAAAAAASFAAAPASANHTLCDNEPTDNWYPIGTGGQGVGFELSGSQNFVCVYHGLGAGGVLIVIRPNGQQTVCTYYTNNQNPSDDVCTVI